MTPIKHVNGDLTDPSSFIDNYDVEENAVFLCHQTNIFGVMSGGVAFSLATKYPEILQPYVDYCNTNPTDIIGTALFTMTNIESIYVVDLFGQPTLNTGRDTDYECIYKALEDFFQSISDYPEWSIAFPKNMSSALAGGKWEIILSMIESFAKDVQNTIYIVEYVPVKEV